MVNEYKDSINLGRIKVSRRDLKLTDGTYKFSIRDFKEIKDYIENGWRFPTKKEFKYIHSIWMDLDGLGPSRNSDYWLYGTYYSSYKQWSFMGIIPLRYYEWEQYGICQYGKRGNP